MTKPRAGDASVPSKARKGAEDPVRQDRKLALWESDVAAPLKPLSPSTGAAPPNASSHRVHPIANSARSPIPPPRFSAALRSVSQGGLPPYSAVDQSPRPGPGLRSPAFHASSIRSSTGSKWPPDPSASLESARSAAEDGSQARRVASSLPGSARNSPQRRALKALRRMDNLHLFDNMATFANHARKSPTPGSFADGASLQSPRANCSRLNPTRSPGPGSPQLRSPKPFPADSKVASLLSPRTGGVRGTNPALRSPRSPGMAEALRGDGTGSGEFFRSPSHSLSTEVVEDSWSRERMGAALSPCVGLWRQAIDLPPRFALRDDVAKPLTSPRPGQDRQAAGALPPLRPPPSVSDAASSECEDTTSMCSLASPISAARSAASSPSSPAPPSMSFIPAVVAPSKPDAASDEADVCTPPKLTLSRPGPPAAVPRIETVPPSPQKSGTSNSSGGVLQECVICMESPRDCLLMPCRHLVVCYDCGQRTEACPVCRAEVEVKIQVFHP